MKGEVQLLQKALRRGRASFEELAGVARNVLGLLRQFRATSRRPRKGEAMPCCAVPCCGGGLPGLAVGACVGLCC